MKRFPLDTKPGERILLDDGKLLFEVISSNQKDEVKAKVIQGGPLKSKKGVNFLIQIFLNLHLPKKIKKMRYLQFLKKWIGWHFRL